MLQSTCVYLIDGENWLMLYRNRKEHDVNSGKYIGVGGKCEDGETLQECALREVREETGLILDDLCFVGDVLFENVNAPTEMITVFTSRQWHGEMIECNEGRLVWVKESDVMGLNLWEGDRIFLERMMKHETDAFHYVFYYDAENHLTRILEREERK